MNIPWNQFFQNSELQKEIDQDIERTYPELDFFHLRNVKEALSRILFIYAKQNPRLLYKQGMHELLAPIFYLLDNEKIENESDILGTLMSATYVEHDAFTLFSSLMEKVKEWFITPMTRESKKEQTPFLINLFDDSKSEIVNKCKYIQNTLLKEKDPELFSQFQQLNIEPQIYMLRWVRLLCGREFHLDDVMVIWDGLFSYDENLSLIDYVCIAMLEFVRNDLMCQDYTSCMKRLFKFPPVPDPHVLIEKALVILENNYKATFTPNLTEKVHPLNNRRFSKSQTFNPNSHNPSTKRLSKALPSASNIVKSLLTEEVNIPVNPLEEEVVCLRNNQQHMANRLERIIYSLQSDVLQYTSGSANESLLMSLAELKQIRDLLMNRLNQGEKKVKKPPFYREEQETVESIDPLGAVIVNPKKS